MRNLDENQPNFVFGEGTAFLLLIDNPLIQISIVNEFHYNANKKKSHNKKKVVTTKNLTPPR